MLHYATLHYAILCYTTLYYTMLHYTTLHYVVACCTAALHYCTKLMLCCIVRAMLYYTMLYRKLKVIQLQLLLHYTFTNLMYMQCLNLALLSSVRLVGLCPGGLFTAVCCKEFLKLLWTLTLLSTLGYFEFKMRI